MFIESEEVIQPEMIPDQGSWLGNGGGHSKVLLFWEK